MRTLIAVFVLAALPFSANAAKVTVTKEQCRNVVAHTPDASVAYQPGVTADGRSVAPADLGGDFTVKPPESITIDIQIDPSKLPSGAGRYLGESTVGKVEYKNGRVYYNGQPVSSGTSHDVIEACKKLSASR
jgi:hypothetical protein